MVCWKVAQWKIIFKFFNKTFHQKHEKTFVLFNFLLQILNSNIENDKKKQFSHLNVNVSLHRDSPTSLNKLKVQTLKNSIKFGLFKQKNWLCLHETDKFSFPLISQFLLAICSNSLKILLHFVYLFRVNESPSNKILVFRDEFAKVISLILLQKHSERKRFSWLENNKN